jgi:hypothetical protein
MGELLTFPECVSCSLESNPNRRITRIKRIGVRLMAEKSLRRGLPAEGRAMDS